MFARCVMFVRSVMFVRFAYLKLKPIIYRKNGNLMKAYKERERRSVKTHEIIQHELDPN